MKAKSSENKAVVVETKPQKEILLARYGDLQRKRERLSAAWQVATQQMMQIDAEIQKYEKQGL